MAIAITGLVDNLDGTLGVTFAHTGGSPAITVYAAPLGADLSTPGVWANVASSPSDPANPYSTDLPLSAAYWWIMGHRSSDGYSAPALGRVSSAASVIQADGPSGGAMQRLAGMVAQSITFRMRAGVATVEQALQRVHYPYLHAPDQKSMRPFAMIESRDYGWSFIAGGDQHFLWPDGALVLTLADNDKYPNSERDGFIHFMNFVDGVLTDLAALAGVDDNLALTGIEQVQPALRTKPSDEAQGDVYWSWRGSVPWGSAA